MGHTNGQTTITVQGTMGTTMATGKTSRITSITAHIIQIDRTNTTTTGISTIIIITTTTRTIKIKTIEGSIMCGQITVATVDHTIAGVEALVGMTTGTKLTMTIIEITEAGVEVKRTTDE